MGLGFDFPEYLLVQARYWRSLQPFVELWGFDPYATPFGAREALNLPPLSPTAPHATPADSPHARQDSLTGASVIHRGAIAPMPASPQVLSRALNRSKWSAQRRQVTPTPPSPCFLADL
jgi:hypothetical protein